MRTTDPLIHEPPPSLSAPPLAPGGPAWDCLHSARRHDPSRRMPWQWHDPGQPSRSPWVGSVPREHLPALLAAWSGRHAGLDSQLLVQDDCLVLVCRAADLDNCLSTLNHAMREAGRLEGWREERFALWPLAATDFTAATALGQIERAATRFWGSWTLGAHANGYVADGHGRPTHLWIGQRSASKSTDPGLLDNLIGGGVPLGQSPHDTLVREAWEEAGLSPALVQPARPAGTLDVLRDIPHGLQRERLFLYDLCLERGVMPCNQDGEVAAFHCLSVADAVQAAATGRMTVDAAISTLDFARRHGLLGDVPDFVAPALQALATPAQAWPDSGALAWSLQNFKQSRQVP